MKEDRFNKTNQMNDRFQTLRLCLSLLICASLFLSGCMMPTPPEVYYGQVIVPKEQEFRWSDGGLPKIFDPSFAAVPPDTDAVRAIYEGLTDYDPNSSEPLPAVAWKWESSSDKREWTFHLRHNAHWSNGDLVTAHDFVLSWQRVLNNREASPHAKLMGNIVGAFEKEKPKEPSTVAEPFPTPETIYPATQTNAENSNITQSKLAVEAVNDFELKIKLIHPNPDFPSLVTHPVFRPVHKSQIETNTPISFEKVVTNGAFELKKNGTDAVVIERAKNYWDAETVNLKRVLFMPMQDVESALAAYKAGRVDAVTNTRFEPLGLKLLEPYKDFRKEIYGALTYYQFNTSRKPFEDLRVREALAIALDRERINEDTLDGASTPANSFLPVQENNPLKKNENSNRLSQNTERAKELLTEAGFPKGAGFPKIKLLVNRNDQQKQVANAVKEMWWRVLNVETEIIIKPWDEYELALKNGEYDIARRGMVMQTINETSNMLAMFEPLIPEKTEQESNGEQTAQPTPNGSPQATPLQQNTNTQSGNRNPVTLILTEEEALRELPSIPIYFSSSYSLVKPYIVGFDSNVLDAPLLKHVKIKTDWKAEPKTSPPTQNLIK